jgi:hypothetical protein
VLHSPKVVLDYGVLTSTRQERQLQPRYRRILSFGDVLDESIGLFRQHWVVFALVSAVCLLPPGLIELLMAAGGALNNRDLLRELASGGTPSVSTVSAEVGPVLVISLLTALFGVAWTAAVAVTTDDYLHGDEPRVARVLARVARRYPILLATGLVALLGLILVGLLAALVLFLSVLLVPIVILGTLGALVGMVVWWVRPSVRSAWLKWLIVVATPLGLLMYVAGAWSLSLVAVVLEHQGPIGALRRSAQLVDQHWFRAMGIVLVAGLIVSVLQGVPTLLVQLPLTILALLRGQLALSAPEQTISLAFGIVTQVLFASMSGICYVVLFMDLRNRREATDIAERVSQLEALENA